MSTLLQAVSEGWSWKIGDPVEVLATNCFGNAIVRNQAGEYFRIMPEEWQCELLARSPAELERTRMSENFARDWEMTILVDRARAAHGPLLVGECFFLVIPGILGGKYSEENIRKISVTELLSYSGKMAQQIDAIPDGETVIIAPQEAEANQAVQRTSAAPPSLT